MAVNQRRKGANFELELSELFKFAFGVVLVRNLDQVRSGGSDLKIVSRNKSGANRFMYWDYLNRFSIEAKRYSQVTRAKLNEFWLQACQQAEVEKKWPMFVVRLDFQEPTFYLPLKVLGVNRNFGTTISEAIAVDVVGLVAIFDQMTESQK